MKLRVLLALLLIGLSSCRPSSHEAASGGGAAAAQDARTITAELVGAPQLGEVQVRVRVLEGSEAVNAARVTVTGDMTHAGMAPVVAEAEPQGDGVYLTQDFAFGMAGDWILTIQAVYPDGGKATKNLAASVPAG